MVSAIESVNRGIASSGIRQGLGAMGLLCQSPADAMRRSRNGLDIVRKQERQDAYLSALVPAAKVLPLRAEIVVLSLRIGRQLLRVQSWHISGCTCGYSKARCGPESVVSGGG